MVKPRLDRRWNRTRKRLTGSLFELIAERRYDDITVQGLIDRADVGRSTFYAHYRDKGDLLLEGWNGFVDLIADRTEIEQQSGRVTVPVEMLLEHLKDTRQLQNGLERSHLVDRLVRIGRQRLAEKLEEKFTSFYGKQESFDPAFAANHIATSLFGLLVWWRENGARHDAKKLHIQYNELLNGGLFSRKE